MPTSRDDFIIAIRSAFLKKSTQQKFSLLTLLFVSIFIILLSNLDFVDFVCPNYSRSAVPAISSIKPQIYCKGKDYKDNSTDISGQIKHETKILKSVGLKQKDFLSMDLSKINIGPICFYNLIVFPLLSDIVICILDFCLGYFFKNS